MWGDTFVSSFSLSSSLDLYFLSSCVRKTLRMLYWTLLRFVALDVYEAEHEFAITWRFRFSDEGFLPHSMEAISVLSHASLGVGSGVSCHGDWEPLESLVKVLGEVKSSSHAPREEVRRK